MNDLSTAMAILSAMITPAVLISACASLILTTSQRLGRVIDRTRRISTRLHLALGIFVATSVAIGIVAISGLTYAWIPTLLGIAGAGLLFYASLLLIAESRVALAAVNDEMDFVLRLSRHRAPAELLHHQDMNP